MRKQSKRLTILDVENSPQSRGVDYAQPLALPHLNVFISLVGDRMTKNGCKMTNSQSCLFLTKQSLLIRKKIALIDCLVEVLWNHHCYV